MLLRFKKDGLMALNFITKDQDKPIVIASYSEEEQKVIDEGVWKDEYLLLQPEAWCRERGLKCQRLIIRGVL